MSFLSLLSLASCIRPTQTPPASPESVAIEQLEPEVALNPKREASNRLVTEGRKELQSGKLERAAQRLSLAVEIDDSNPFAYFFLGLARLRGGRWGEGATFFSRAAAYFSDLPPWKAESLAYRGECLAQLGKKDEAIRAFDQALSADDSNTRAVSGRKKLE